MKGRLYVQSTYIYILYFDEKTRIKNMNKTTPTTTAFVNWFDFVRIEWAIEQYSQCHASTVCTAN